MTEEPTARAHSGSVATRRQRLAHPLSGANVATLCEVLRRNGSVSPRHVPQILFALAAALLRWPFSTAERMLVGRRMRRVPGGPPPVFIVGHWRSGTTHLYNVMSRDPRLATVPPVATGMPWDFLGLARLLRPLLDRALPEGRFIDSIPVNPDSPQEDEIALANMQPLSFYHGLYFPRRFEDNFRQGIFLEGCSAHDIERWKWCLRHLYFKLGQLHPGRRLLIKNPVYSARVALLADMFPGAKFIHIHRNPYKVFESMRNFYRVLLRQFALQPFDHVVVDEFILESYPRIMQALLADSRRLPTGDFIELRFEEFQRDPMGQLQRVYETCGLGSFDPASGPFQRYLDSVRSYRKNVYEFAPERLARVRRHWGTLIDSLDYAPPA